MNVFDEPQHGRWHIKREISTGDIILACTIIVAIGLPMLAWAVGVTNRISVLEERLTATAAQEQRDAQIQNEAMRDSVTRIEGALHDIQSYLLAHTAAQGR